MANKIQLRRGQKSAMPTLSSGEPAYATDTRELFIGTGSGNVNMGGNHWYRGTAMSGTSTTTNAYSYSACPQVKLGDLYLNTSNGNIYACTTAGSGSSAKWTYQGCMKGPQGATGATGPQGEAAYSPWENTGPAEYSIDGDISVNGCVTFNPSDNGTYASIGEIANDIGKLKTYSSTPTVVGTWVDGKPIYRIAWSFTKAQFGNRTLTYLDDLPNCPSSVSNAGNGGLIREHYCYARDNAVTKSESYGNILDLQACINKYKSNITNYTVYCVIEYVLG